MKLGPPTDAELHEMSYLIRHADWQVRTFPIHHTRDQLLELLKRNTPKAYMAAHFPRQCGVELALEMVRCLHEASDDTRAFLGERPKWRPDEEVGL